MSEIPSAVPATRYMRDERKPFLPAGLEEAAAQRIAGGPASLSKVRGAALDALRRAGLPQGRSEDYTFIRLSEVMPRLSEAPRPGGSAEAGRVPPALKTSRLPGPEAVRALVFPESRESYLVLVDGEYAPGLSHPGESFHVSTLEAALGRPGTGKSRTDASGDIPAGSGSGGTAGHPAGGLEEALVAALSRETDAAALLAALFADQPLHIRVDAKAVPSSPLQIIHLRAAGDAARSDAFLVLSAGRLSESRVLVRHADLAAGEAGPGDKGPEGRNLEDHGPGGGPMANIHTLALLEDAASVKWFEAAPEGPGLDHALHFRKLAAVLERDSRLFAASASAGSRLTRHAYAVDLRGPGADAEINGAAVLTDSRQSHAFVQVRHLAPNCSSRQHFKTVAADRGRASVDGTIFVAEGAQQTQANQLINNLMLSDEARADSKPRLLIHADDVKCSHGATAGKLGPDQLFYLESRGLEPAQARALLTLAFIAEIVERTGQAETGGSPEASGFRAHLDATLLAALKGRLEARAPENASGAAVPGGAPASATPPDSPKGA